MDDYQVDATHYAMSVLEPGCSHPELNMTLGPWPRDERIYWCSMCKKKIVIPLLQASLLLDRNAQENFAGMIELAFGEQWGNLAREGKL